MIRKPSADRRAGCKGVENEEDQAAFLYFGNYDKNLNAFIIFFFVKWM